MTRIVALLKKKKIKMHKQLVTEVRMLFCCFSFNQIYIPFVGESFSKELHVAIILVLKLIICECPHCSYQIEALSSVSHYLAFLIT